MFSLRIYALKTERAHGMENGQGSREHDSSHAWVYGKAYVNSMSTKADFFSNVDCSVSTSSPFLGATLSFCQQNQ